jgi:hypothetical protein
MSVTAEKKMHPLVMAAILLAVAFASNAIHSRWGFTGIVAALAAAAVAAVLWVIGFWLYAKRNDGSDEGAT